MKARSISATGWLRLAIDAACFTLGGIVAPNHAPAQTTLPAYIGTAEMSSDGTITLRFRAEDSKRGIFGHSVLAYPRSHSQYEAILRHVGPLKPGETKSAALAGLRGRPAPVARAVIATRLHAGALPGQRAWTVVE